MGDSLDVFGDVYIEDIRLSLIEKVLRIGAVSSMIASYFGFRIKENQAKRRLLW